MIKRDFFVFGLEAKAQAFTSACHLCIQYKSSQLRRTPLGHSPLPLTKASVWHLDFVVGLPPTSSFDGYLSIIDPYSGFRIVIPI